MDHFSLHLYSLIILSLYVCLLPITPYAADANANAIAFHSMENNITSENRIALLSFKSMLVDPLGSLTSWDNTTSLHYCMWRGVTCRRRHPLHVVALDLDSLGLSGPISPNISNLTFLARLHLSDNQLQGSIPEELGLLSRLRYLNLSMNNLQGEIPATLSHCSRLQNISLWDNKLRGNIPSNLTRCFDLRLLSLSGNMLDGEIPTDIATLPMLDTLILSRNQLRGRIPPLLGSSPSLTYVDLGINSLTGAIPQFLANSSTLQYLILATNNLTGGIPPSLSNSSLLVYLDLASNTLTGGIPPFKSSLFFLLGLSSNYLTGGIPLSLGNLSSLQYLYLADNRLEGIIPENLGNIPSLQELDLSINHLSNKIPSSLYNLSAITYLGLGDNNLSGMLPPDMGLALPYLQNLVVQTNQLEGPIPVSMSNASGLEILNLGYNSFSGVVPSNLGSLQNLRQLNLGWNQLQAHDWSFMSSLTNCSLLERLFLNDNKLEGSLPSSVGALSTLLEWLLVKNNQISGTIPAEIGNLVNLTVVYLDHNLFVGSIPSAIEKLKNLHVLDLSTNKLSGSIPYDIGNLAQLNEFYMQENELNGTIPASFGGCKGLLALNLSHNSLGGTIPRELVSLASLTQFMDLSHNSLGGSIPMEVGHLINLGSLNVSENKLSGDIPSTIGNCLFLEKLRMEGNSFKGNIPQSFMNLKGLQELDLSRNKLSGPIPDFFGSLVSLHSLNLSFNDFEGEVPSGGVFNNTSEISVLGNKNLCGSHSKLRLPSCLVNAHDQPFNSLKVILPTVSAIIVILLCVFGILYRRRMTVIRGRSSTSSLKDDKYMKVSYADIHKSTDGFSSTNLIGVGSFGSVYRGKVEERTIAVKVLNLYHKGASSSFTAECEALRNIRHRNLVKIITTCSSLDQRGNEFKALVFDYMPKGSLERWLHPDVGPEHHQSWTLTLSQRLNIAIDVASALNYLHHSCEPPVVHCDIKPGNILLDIDMTAHVGDFGQARILTKSIPEALKKSTSLVCIKGTVGYVAPEYGMGSQVSIQGDVYSFGILLLEMLTGKKPTDDMFKDGLSLRRYVEMAFPEGFMQILDPQLALQDEGEEVEGRNTNGSITEARRRRCIFLLIRVGLSCSDDAPKGRMKMEDVATEIHTIKELFSSDQESSSMLVSEIDI